MKILGIGGQGYRDSSAALVVDGRVVAAAAEERFTRVKHDGGFPHRSVEFCLNAAGLDAGELDRIAVANNPWLNLRDRLVEWYGEGFLGSRRFRTYDIFHDELHASAGYLSELERWKADFGDRFRKIPHHICHMAESFCLSPFEEAAILSIDGRGEVSTSSQGKGSAGGIEVFSVEEMPNSIGLLCAAVADFLGFREEDDEFRIMSISSIGRSRYVETFRNILGATPEGGYTLDPEYVVTVEGRTYLADRFYEELGPSREPGAEVTERHADVAASLQTALEELALKMAGHLAERTGYGNLCLSGGVSQNWVLGGRIRADGPFERVHTGFAAGDEGTALGAALYVRMTDEGSARAGGTLASDLGPGFPLGSVTADLARVGLPPEEPANEVEDAAEEIAAGKLTGWFEGRMEFGPRALGHRSIFADPTNAQAKERLAESVKPRARYHPFGIAVAVQDLSRYFEDTRADPHMTSHRSVKEGMREVLAPVLHVDGTARVQTVDPERSPKLGALLEAVGRRTGHPVLLNTSLNVPGRPIAMTALDAVEVFYTTGLDVLYLEGAKLTKP